MTAPVTVAHSSTIAICRLVQPSRTNATLAPALVATTEIRLAPTATYIGTCANMTSAGTMKTPPPRPDSAPTKPAPTDRARRPPRIESTLNLHRCLDIKLGEMHSPTLLRLPARCQSVYSIAPPAFTRLV